MTREFTHYPLGEEVEAAAGRYSLQKEARITVNGNEIFYLVAFASVDSSCCSVGGMGYAIVPGCLIKWKDHLNRDGLPVSIVEPVDTFELQEQIRKSILQNEGLQQVNFLT